MAFRLLGIPVRVDPSFLLVAGVLGLGLPGADLVGWVVVVFASVLAHELGHALTARAFGSPVRIELVGISGLTYHDPMSPGRGLLVTLAGPGTGLAIGGALALSGAGDWGADDLAARLLAYATWANVVWSLLNLLPILPLDGGIVARHAGEIVMGRDVERPVRVLSVVVAVGAGVFAWRSGYSFSAIFAVFLAAENIRALRASADRSHERTGLRPGTGDRRDDRAHAAAWNALQSGDVDRAATIVEGLERAGDRAPTLHAAVHLVRADTARALAWLADAAVSLDHDLARDEWIVLLDDARAAPELAARLGAITDDNAPTVARHLQARLHRLGRYASAIEVGRILYERAGAPGERRAAIAYDIACGLGRSGAPDDAFAWLDRAAADGFDDSTHADADTDLESLRTDPRWAATRAAIARNAARTD